MADYELTITAHPSIADDPFGHGKLMKDGQPVTAAPPAHRAVRYNGHVVGLCSIGRTENLLVQFFGMGTNLPESVKEEAKELAAKEGCYKDCKTAETITANQPAPPTDEDINTPKEAD